jgi:hypothetical protein
LLFYQIFFTNFTNGTSNYCIQEANNVRHSAVFFTQDTTKMVATAVLSTTMRTKAREARKDVV